ncbi:MAG: ABC transporter permease [Methanomassiliicoccaceae archaeon]|nr:ABC transporter permease [Methanomassiliicoccaceae archaeon]
MMYIELDDFRQSYVVAKNEIRKFVRGKRFAIYVALIIFVFAVITLLQHFNGGGLGGEPGAAIMIHLFLVSFLIILSATLFASVVTVSEFEERTALILFTRPIKKTSIFLGKMLGCIALEVVMIVLFYAGLVALSLIGTGSVPSELFVSLGIASLLVVAMSGIAMFISSIMKKGSTSAILTFFLLIFMVWFLPDVVSMTTGTMPWFFIDQAATAIYTGVPGSLAALNDSMAHIGEMAGFTLEQIEELLIPAPDMTKVILSVVGWSVASTVLAWIAFIRREF